MQEIIELKGREPGPTSVVLVGVHGNERCGIEALEKLLPNLKIEKGCVYVGYGNPRAIEKKSRFTETNLNRMFKPNRMLSSEDLNSYEYDRAQYLKRYFGKSEALLDIHASLTSKSEPFIICETNAKSIVKYLPVGLVVSGFDRIEPGGTDYYMNSIGKIGICVECGYLGNPKSVQIAEESILAFLNARGQITNGISPKKQSYIRMYDLYMTKTDNFILSKQFDDFEEVSKGQIIGIDGEKEVRVEKDAVILFARNRKRVGDEAFLLGEKKNSLA